MFDADDALLGAWVRLLIVADAVYPAAPPVPRAISDSALATLTEAGRIQRLPGDFYRVPAVNEERRAGSERGRIGGLASAVRAERERGGEFAARSNAASGKNRSAIPVEAMSEAVLRDLALGRPVPPIRTY
jgi:hypothetical protein